MKKKNQSRSEKKYSTVTDYKRCFSTTHGKKVIQDLIFYYFSPPSFDKDPYKTAYNEGKRHVVGHILQQIKADPEVILKLIKEAEDEYRNDASILDRDASNGWSAS